MIQAGTTLQQRYKIDKQIGQGGMGAVYIATDERFGSTVAIKETLCMDDNFRKAIEREARLLNSLKHSALPRVSDHFEESNGQFLVMEYIPGDDVASILERDQRPFPVEQVVGWAHDLLDALDYLHNQEIPVIHRDIKPQNLKITPRGQIILLDFGLAKGNPTDASHQTAAKSIFGYSKNYASLEQIQGTGTDPRSDLYSLAATLYHLITNVAPEDALTRAMAVLSQKPDPLVPANMVNPAVPAGVAGVLQKALDLNASERPSSAAEMRKMLMESENYAYLTDGAAFAQAPTAAHVFAQPTQLMSDATHAEPLRQFDIRTAVMSGDPSQATSVRSGNTDASQRRGSGLAVAAGALTVLLVGAAVAGGIYVFKPSVFGAGTADNSNTDVTTTVPVATNANSAAPNANASNVAITSGPTTSNPTAGANEPAKQAGTADRPTDTGKDTKAAVESKPMTKVELGKDMTVELDNMEDPENVTITTRNPDGTVRTMNVKPNRPPVQGAPPPGFDPFPKGFDPSQLTPEQRRKLQNLMRNRYPRPVPPMVPSRTPTANKP